PVFLRVVRAEHVIRLETAPGRAVPVRARAADIVAGQERAQAADRQRDFAPRVPQRDGFLSRVLKELMALGIAELVADVWNREILARAAHRAALESNHVQAGFGELARENAPGPAHADDDDVCLFKFRDHRGGSLTKVRNGLRFLVVLLVVVSLD